MIEMQHFSKRQKGVGKRKETKLLGKGIPSTVQAKLYIGRGKVVWQVYWSLLFLCE